MMEKRPGKQKKNVKRHKHCGDSRDIPDKQQVQEIPETQNTPSRQLVQDDCSSSSGSSIANGPNSREVCANNGIIESVFLKDFMCHSCLEFRFGENVNFVIGRNGSGKSAILMAIVVALGGKANVTSRGTSLKNFIKSGKREARVVVRLRNMGIDGYRPEEYGPQIVIERRLTIEGHNSYKIMSQSGKGVSTKREELIRILDHFNIQVDNPISVLNQEVSRNFLNSKNNKDKYIFFLKATQLEQLRNEYSLTEEQKRIAEGLMKRKKQNIALLELELKEWDQKRELLDSLAKQKEKLEKLKFELIWAHVKHDEEQVTNRRVHVDKAKAIVEACKKKIDEYQNKVSGCMAERNRIHSELEVVTEKIKSIQPQHKLARNALLELKQQFRAKQLDMRKVENSVNSLQRDEEELRKNIENLRPGEQDNFLAQRQERLEKIEQLEREKGERKACERSTSVHYDQLKSSMAHMTEEVQSLRDEQNEKRLQMESLQSQIRNLEGSRSDQLRKFGRYIPELKKAIDVAFQQRRFVEKPRGPIGAYVKVKDQRWALAVEVCIRSLMTTFCCDNHKDEAVLEQLMRKVIRQGSNPSIIVSKFSNQVYDVREYAVKTANYPSVLDMLDISDPVVANCIIDQRGIESILLIANNKEACSEMLRNVPRNCHETFTMCGDHVFPSPNFRYYSNSRTQPEFLHRDLTEQIRQKHAELDELKRQSLALEEKMKHSISSLNTHKQELKTVETNLERIRKTILDLDLKIMDLKNIEEPEDVDVAVLEEELNGIILKRQELVAQRDLGRQELQQLRHVILQKESEYAQLESTVSDLLQSADPLKEKINEAETKLQDVQERKRHYDARLRELNQKARQEEEKHEEEMRVLQGKMRKAEAICPRITSTRTIPSLESQVIKLEEHLKRQESSQGSHEDVLAKYVELKTKYDSMVKLVKRVEEFLSVLNKSLHQRKLAYERFRQQLTLRTKVVFINALSQRNFLGKLIIDHEKETLDILIHPDDKGSKMLNDMHSLSGGERSFTTVCLIIAMWDSTESPFRILDEFDVFMDMVTRRVSMDVMMSTALQKQKCQFVFLTPLGMSSIPPSRHVRICQMPDPDRNQSVLPFASAQEDNESEANSEV